jgi:hypothetical protein
MIGPFSVTGLWRRRKKPKGAASRHAKMYARLLLQIAYYAEKVLGLRVAARTEHAD